MEVCEEKFFNHLPKLALGLATIYSSSSEAERDLGHLNNIFAGDKKSNLNQENVEDKMAVQSTVYEEGKSCKRCIENDRERDRKMKEGVKVPRRVINHGHCGFLEPN